MENNLPGEGVLTIDEQLSCALGKGVPPPEFEVQMGTGFPGSFRGAAKQGDFSSTSGAYAINAELNCDFAQMADGVVHRSHSGLGHE
jgi:hypothetical protein